MQDTDPAPTTSQAERLADWIRLERTPGVGRVTARLLLDHFHTPAAIFSAGYDTLAALVSPARARALCAPPTPPAADYLQRVHDWLARPANSVITPDHPAYPALLRQIPDPPLVLYAIGRTELLARPSLAIVGSRNASLQGAANARAFAHAMGTAGLTIVSGLALGIDAAAHEGALGTDGSTVAVTGTGADRIYPPANAALARRIAAEGCIISECSLGDGPRSGHFPMRNRIISGLARGVLVVEAAAGSGSLITAHVAAEQGRDVFAIPGSIQAPLSKGCHKLIKEGARLVESVDDLLQELRLGPMPEPIMSAQPEAGGAEHAELLDIIGYGPVDCNTIAAGTTMAPGLIAGQLLTLELAGLVERLPGGLFQRVNR